ncbi:hypothetical protein EEB12_28985 [Rhodococcus sp. WS1]|nr:hypothetical protein EEB12_28985 [Rhodococcus sp. WS1]TQC35965.1 hypothetical protein EEB16_20600 [Rhodococcus sp. WS7]
MFAINPLSVSRYRDRYSPSRTKSDAADAMILANILRTDNDNRRRLPNDLYSRREITAHLRRKGHHVASGGQGGCQSECLARTHGDQVGECFDKCRKALVEKGTCFAADLLSFPDHVLMDPGKHLDGWSLFAG